MKKCRCAVPIVTGTKPTVCRTCRGTVSLSRATYGARDASIIERARDRVFEDKVKRGGRDNPR